MDWIESRGSWECGPYLIELAGPRHWILTRTEEDNSPDSLVRTEKEWSGRSLRKMKEVAESIELRRSQVRSTKRSVLVLITSALVFSAAVVGSGRVSAVVAIIAAGVLLFALSRVIDGWRHRPWDNVRSGYQ